MEMTIINSSNVKPREVVVCTGRAPTGKSTGWPRPVEGPGSEVAIVRAGLCGGHANLWVLPITVLLSVERGPSRFGKHVENILPAPRSRVLRVVRGPDLPIALARHRIDRNGT